MRVVLSALFFLAQTVWAQAAITPQELRDLAYAGDIDGVEAALAQAHQESLNGALSYEELRELVTILIVTHPDVLDFVDDWLQAYPDSPYAQSLKVFQTQKIAWGIRSNAVAHKVSPEAMQTFQAMQREGMDLALSAYQTAPDYIPASDAVLTHNLTTKRLSADEHLEVLTAVMQVTPSRGSLARASMLASQQWGGRGYGALIGLCDRFAGLVTDVDNYTPDVCVIDLIHYYPSTDAGRAYSYELMERVDHPILAKARARRGLDRGLPEDQDDVIAYLLQPEVLDHWMVRKFEHVFLPISEVDALMEQYTQKKRAYVDDGLLHDPYDVDVLFAAFDFYDGSVIDPVHGIRVSDPEMERVQFLLARRHVAASPYRGHVWTRMANVVPGQPWSEQNLRESAITYDAAFVNGIYYSDHDIGPLLSYLRSRMSLHNALQRLKEEGRTTPLTVTEELDHVTCPIIRVARLHRARCDADGLDDQRCYLWSSSTKDRIREAVTSIQQQGVCHYEQSASAQDLLYTEPIAFDLGELDEGIFNR